MAEFVNGTGVIGSAITNFTTGTTGDLMLTFFLILAFFILLGIIFRLPLEITLSLALPFIIVVVSAFSSFWAVGGIIAIYLGIIFARIFFLR